MCGREGGKEALTPSSGSSSYLALEAQETHQPLTHNYLKKMGEGSCPQIMVKTADSQRAAHGVHSCILYTTTVSVLSVILTCLCV